MKREHKDEFLPENGRLYYSEDEKVLLWVAGRFVHSSKIDEEIKTFDDYKNRFLKMGGVDEISWGFMPNYSIYGLETADIIYLYCKCSTPPDDAWFIPNKPEWNMHKWIHRTHIKDSEVIFNKTEDYIPKLISLEGCPPNIAEANALDAYVKTTLDKYMAQKPSDTQITDGNIWLGSRSVMILLGKMNPNNSKKNSRIIDMYNNESTYFSKTETIMLMKKAYNERN